MSVWSYAILVHNHILWCVTFDFFAMNPFPWAGIRGLMKPSCSLKLNFFIMLFGSWYAAILEHYFDELILIHMQGCIKFNVWGWCIRLIRNFRGCFVWENIFYFRFLFFTFDHKNVTSIRNVTFYVFYFHFMFSFCVFKKQWKQLCCFTVFI